MDKFLTVKDVQKILHCCQPKPKVKQIAAGEE